MLVVFICTANHIVDAPTPESVTASVMSSGVHDALVIQILVHLCQGIARLTLPVRRV